MATHKLDVFIYKIYSVMLFGFGQVWNQKLFLHINEKNNIFIVVSNGYGWQIL